MEDTLSSERIRTHELSISRGSRSIISALSFSLGAGELLGLVGPNGAGKSTLLASLAGIEEKTSGEITIDHKSLSSLSSAERAKRIAWLEQSPTVHWPMTVERIVTLGRTPHLPTWRKPEHKDIEAIERALFQTDCLYLREQRFHTLSGGEKLRVLLARALAVEPTLLLADEPVATLDLKHQLKTMQLIRHFCQGFNAAIVVMHDLSLAARFCDRLLLLHEGRLVCVDHASAVLTKNNLESVYGVAVQIGQQTIPWVLPERIL